MKWNDEDAAFAHSMTSEWKGANKVRAHRGLRAQHVACRILRDMCPKYGKRLFARMLHIAKTDPYNKTDVWNIDFKDTLVEDNKLDEAMNTRSIVAPAKNVLDKEGRPDTNILVQTLSDDAAQETKILGWTLMGTMRLHGYHCGDYVLLPRQFVRSLDELITWIENDDKQDTQSLAQLHVDLVDALQKFRAAHRIDEAYENSPDWQRLVGILTMVSKKNA